MRTSTIFTIASLFLIGSFSLPQPENLEASSTIEDREAKPPPGAGHGGGAEWWKHHKSDGTTSSSNSTKIKEREAHEKPGTFHSDPEHHHDGWPSSSGSGNSTKIKEREAHEKSGTFHSDPEHHHDGWPSSSGSGNSTKIKERQDGPPGRGDFTPPDGMTWMEYMKHKHKTGSRVKETSSPASTGGALTSSEGSGSNSTKVKMMKFRD